MPHRPKPKHAKRGVSKAHNTQKKVHKQEKAGKRFIRGKGDYLVPESSLKQIGKTSAGRALGSAAGGLFGPAGSAIGGAIGSFMHRGLKTLTGMGDYHERNTALTRRWQAMAGPTRDVSLASVMPEFATLPAKNGGNMVCHSESLGPVYGSINFKNTSYLINAGRRSFFPWLSANALNYTEAYHHGVVVVFKSNTSDSSSGSAQIGDIVLSHTLNPTEPDFTTMQYAATTAMSSEFKASQDAVHGIECSPKQVQIPIKRVLNDSAAANPIQDLGKFQFCTQGFPTDGGVIGTLHVVYAVELMQPEIYAGASGSTALWDGQYQYAPTQTSTFTRRVGSGLAANLYKASGTTLALQMPKVPGTYRFDIVSRQSAANSVSATFGWDPVNASTDVADLNMFPNGSGLNQQQLVSALSGSTAMYSYTFKYVPHIQGATNDIVISVPRNLDGSSTQIYLVQAQLFRMDDYLVAVESDEERFMRYVARIQRNPDAVSSPQVSAVVVQTTINENVTTQEQWPYSGPCPPSNEDAARYDGRFPDGLLGGDTDEDSGFVSRHESGSPRSSDKPSGPPGFKSPRASVVPRGGQDFTRLAENLRQQVLGKQ